MGWRDIAYDAASKAYTEGHDLGLTGKALKAHLNKAYPFGVRQYHPYKIWLDVVKKLLNPGMPSRRPCKKAIMQAPGQCSLFNLKEGE
jgi:hypothetical protein